MTVSASVVVHDSPQEELCRLLDSLSASAIDRVWVVYNGPDADFFHELRDRLASFPKEVSVVRTENNGYGAGHNVAIREAMADGCRYHLVVNPDVCWQGDVATPIVAYFESHPEAGIIAPLIRYPDGRLQYNARLLPSPADLFVRRLVPGFLRKRHDRRYLLQDLDPSEPVNAPYLLGCFMFFRMEALREAGLFDERFFMYPEDIDITRRLHRRWQTLRLPVATVIHTHRRASVKSLRMLRVHLINMLRYFRKWGFLHDPERRLFNREVRGRLRGRLRGGRGGRRR